MRSRAPPSLVAPLLLLVLVLASAPGPQATYVEENSFRFFPVARNQTFYAGDFHPDGDAALLAGGVLAQHPEPDDQYLVRYDGTSWDVVFKRAGTYDGPLMEVAWRPQGDYALIPAAGGPDAQGELQGSILACTHPCRNASQVRDLWRPDVTLLAREDRGFAARKAAWHPGGDHALVSGSGLVRWNGTTFTTVEAGDETFYNAVEWHPSGEMALVQRGLDGVRLCLDPCETSAHLLETGVVFGESGGSSAIEAFAFHPGWDAGHDKAYAVGVDKQRSKILEITMGDRTDPGTWSTAYYNPMATDDEGNPYAAYGEMTGMAWYPDGSRALVSASLSQQVSSFPRDPSGPHDLQRLLDVSGPKLFGTTMAPDGGYALFGTQDGFYRYDPDGVPVTDVVTPDPEGDPTFLDPFTARGTAEPKDDGRNVTAIEWTLSASVEGFARTDEDGWRPLEDGNWTRASDGTVDWSLEVDPSGLQPGGYLLGVRADDGEVVGPPGLTSFRVPGPEVAFEAPANRSEADGRVAVNGTATPRAPDGEVTAVEWRVTPGRSPGAPGSGGWTEANLTPENGSARWDLTWDASARDPCVKTVEVRALEDEIVGRPSYLEAYVPGCLYPAPPVNVTHVDHGNDTVTLDWTPHHAAAEYTVEVAENQTFFETTTLANVEASTTTFQHDTGGNGTYHYRVRAANAYEETAWGTAEATVEDPPPGDDPDGNSGDGDDGADDRDEGDAGNPVIGDGTADDGEDESDDPDAGPGGGSDPPGGSDGAPVQDTPGPGTALAAAALAVAALRRRRGR